MAKKLAITIAGAVSLGCYEAGVLFEVLDAIRQHNTNPATTEEDRIEIDVLTGASAGGMTAIILAQKLLYSGNEFVGPYDNPLYNTWVKRISLEGLVATEEDEPALHSLFSSDLIAAISRETLLARYDGASIPPPARYEAAAPAIRVGVAMTNLNGVGYGYPVVPGGKFVYLDYCDQLTRHVNSGDAACDTEAFWEPLRQAAVACGAFPIAFRPQDMERSCSKEKDDYPKDNLETWAQDPMTFTYSDGGILQNQPLGMAKNLVDMFDDHLNQENRFYLFVSPTAKDPEADGTFCADKADYLHLLLRLITVMMGQAGFQDWITTQDVNQRVRLLDERADELREMIANAQIDLTALETTSTALLHLFFKNGEHLSPGARAAETLGDAQIRIATQYAAEIASLGGMVTLQGRAFRDAVLAFETAAGLGARDHMTIYGVTATNCELASGALAAFLGFFDQKFRDHDYDVGRDHARKVLIDAALSAPGAIGPIRFIGTAINDIDGTLNGMQMGAVSDEDVKVFSDGVKRRIHAMIDADGIPWPIGFVNGAAKLAADGVWDVVLRYLESRKDPDCNA